MIPVLILAAGQSSRMRGRDKLLEQAHGLPLLRHSALIALQAQIGPVHVALPPAPHPRYDALQDLDLTPVPVPDADQGMTASLRAGLRALPDCAAFMLMLADLPDLTAHDLRLVAEASSAAPDCAIWRGATAQGAPGHPVVFGAVLIPELLALSGDDGARAVVKRHQSRLQLVPLPGTRARTDLDTPEAWAAWHRANPG